MARRLPQAAALGVVVIAQDAKSGAKKRLAFRMLAEAGPLSHRRKSENNDTVLSFSQIFNRVELIMRTL